MTDRELDFAIDVVDPAPSRTPLRLVLVACAVASSLTFVFHAQLEATKNTLLAAPALLQAARTRPAVAVAPEAVQAPEQAPPPVEPARAPLPSSAHKPRLARATPPPESSVRAVMKEGRFVLERTGAAPVVARKRPAPLPGGDLDDLDDVDDVMRDRAAAFRACYESALRRETDLAGSFDLAFTIDAGGAVKTATVRSRVNGPPASVAPLGHCIKGVLKRTRFAPAPSTTTVSRTLTFRPNPSI